MAKQEITYKAAVKEVEDILEKIEDGQLDVDELTINVKRVTELLKICKNKLQKTEDEWRKLLRPDQFTVLRKEGTEPPNSSPLNNIEGAGTFVCAGCFLPLFHTAHKYDSGTGWPSFWRPL